MKKYFESINRKVLMATVLVSAFILTTTVAYAAMTLSTDTITGSGALNINPTGQPVTVNGNLTVTGGVKTTGVFGSTLNLDDYWYGDPNGYKFGALLDISPSDSDLGSGTTEGLHIDMNVDPTADYTHSVNGLGVLVTAGEENGQDVQNVNAGSFQAVKDGAGSTDYLQSGDFRTQMYNGTANYLWGLYVYVAPSGGTVNNKSSGIYIDLPGTGATVASHYGLYMADQTGVSPGKDYAFWYNGTSASAGVWRVNNLGIEAYYNPSFAAYTPGAANYERIVTQWNSNVAEIGPEAGGTGTQRALRLLGSSVDATAYKVGGVAGLSAVKTVKGSDGNNCTMTFVSGLLTATTCP